MKLKEKETKHFVSMYGSSLTHAHDKQHAYMEWGATSKSCVRFICLKSRECVDTAFCTPYHSGPRSPMILEF